MTPDPLRRLGEIENHLEDLREAQGKDAFALYYEHADVDLASHEKKMRDAALEPEVAETCEAVLAGDCDATAKRRARILSNWITQIRVDTDEIIDLKNDIQKIVIHTKPTLDGEEIPRNAKTKILFNDEDRDKRRRAFNSEGQLRSELLDRARRLYRMKNESARALGFEDYPTLVLAGEDLTVDELNGIFDKYEAETRPAYEELIAEGAERFGLERVEPWDLNYVATKITSADDNYFPRAVAMPSLTKVVTGYGRDLDSMGIVIHEDADIPYGGLCFSIRTPTDIRILVNLKDGMQDLHTLYHEFGHAVHRKFTGPEYYTLKAGDTGFFAEAMADTWGMLVHRPAWLDEYTDMSEDEIGRIDRAADKTFACRVRRFMARQSFEIDAYRDPDGDMDAALDRHAERFLGFGYNDPERWAEEYFPLLYPIYSKNYMLARVIQRAVHRHLEKEYGEILDQPKVFDFLVDNFYRDGALLTWKEKLAAVGASL
ncbi:MAG: M3 family metallopeptidase [Candidatus Zixiibacteriota bacterium]|jgi:peptidyl-dipeptidase A